MNGSDLMIMIGRVSGEYRRLFHSVLDENGYNGIKGGGRILHVLSGQDGMSQKELAMNMQIRPQSLTGVLEKLEKAGMIERKRSSLDRREQNVFITDTGREHCTKLMQFRRQAAEKLLGSMTESEKEKLGELLGIILSSAEGR